MIDYEKEFMKYLGAVIHDVSGVIQYRLTRDELEPLAIKAFNDLAHESKLTPRNAYTKWYYRTKIRAKKYLKNSKKI